MNNLSSLLILMRIYPWMRKPHWLLTFKRGGIVETAFGSGCVSQRNEGLLWVNYDISWSEVLLNIQRALYFVVPVTRIKQTTKNAHRYSTTKRPMEDFSVSSLLILMRIYPDTRIPGGIVETAFGSGCVSQRNEGLLSINHDMSWSEVLMNIQRSPIFCRTGDENQTNN